VYNLDYMSAVFSYRIYVVSTYYSKNKNKLMFTVLTKSYNMEFLSF
jgi:hypothetical protein